MVVFAALEGNLTANLFIIKSMIKSLPPASKTPYSNHKSFILNVPLKPYSTSIFLTFVVIMKFIKHLNFDFCSCITCCVCVVLLVLVVLLLFIELSGEIRYEDDIQLCLHKLKDLHVCLNSIKDWTANIFHQHILISSPDSLVQR